MTYGIYAVRDVKMGYAQPILDSSDETAIRNFSSQCKNAQFNPTLFYNPQDFSLYKIGEYDTDTAMLTAITPPSLLVEAVSFKTKDGE